MERVVIRALEQTVALVVGLDPAGVVSDESMLHADTVRRGEPERREARLKRP